MNHFNYQMKCRTERRIARLKRGKICEFLAVYSKKREKTLHSPLWCSFTSCGETQL